MNDVSHCCVFPVLALKALHLAKSGGDEREARRDALGYAAGAIAGTGALGVGLLALRAGGSAVGWAFQLQDPRTILILLLLFRPQGLLGTRLREDVATA